MSLSDDRPASDASLSHEPTATSKDPTGLAFAVAAWADWGRKQRALVAVLRLFERAGVPLLPVKGILLSPLLYEDPRERALGDIDILVRPQDFRRAAQAARRAGWPLVWDSRQLGNVNFIVEGVSVDLATSMGPPGCSALGVAHLLDRSQTTTAIIGHPHRRIEWHDHTLLMALDAFKDKLGAKASARADLVRMADAPHFVPEKLVARAEAAELITMLAIVAKWVLERPSSVWERVARLTDPRHKRFRYARAFEALVRRTSPSQRRTVALALLARAVSDSPKRRIEALVLGGAGAVTYRLRNPLTAKPRR